MEADNLVDGDGISCSIGQAGKRHALGAPRVLSAKKNFFFLGGMLDVQPRALVASSRWRVEGGGFNLGARRHSAVVLRVGEGCHDALGDCDEPRPDTWCMLPAKY